MAASDVPITSQCSCDCKVITVLALLKPQFSSSLLCLLIVSLLVVSVTKKAVVLMKQVVEDRN